MSEVSELFCQIIDFTLLGYAVSCTHNGRSAMQSDDAECE